MAQMKLVPSYRFDKYGYYIGETRSMMDTVTGKVFMPSDCVLFAPEGINEDYRISADKSKWEQVTSVEDMDPIDLIACADDTDDRTQLIRARINSEVACDSRYVVFNDTENHCLYVKEAPKNEQVDELLRLKSRYHAALDRLQMNYYRAFFVINRVERDKFQSAYEKLANAETEEEVRELLDKIDGLEDFVTEGEKALNRAIQAKQVLKVMSVSGFDKSIYRNQQYLRERRAYSKALGFDSEDDYDNEG